MKKIAILLMTIGVLVSCKENTKDKTIVKTQTEIASKTELKDTIGDCSKNQDLIDALPTPKKIGNYTFDSAMCFAERGIVYSFSVPNETKDHAMMISIFDTNSKKNNWKLKDFKDGFLESQKSINTGHSVVKNAIENYGYTVVTKYDEDFVANYYSIFKERYVFNIQIDHNKKIIKNTQMEAFANEYLSKIDLSKLN
jgi:hypothetical protein